MEPITIATIATAAAAAGAGISAYGQVQQGKAAKREADYSAATQDNNAITAGYAAIQEGQNAQREADQIREHRLRTIGSQRTAAAHSGLTLSGSVLDVMSDTSIQSEQDIQLALYRGQIGAYNQQGAATNFRNQATMTRMAGANAKRGAYFQAAGTLLSGIGQAAGGYANFRSAGGYSSNNLGSRPIR